MFNYYDIYNIFASSTYLSGEDMLTGKNMQFI